MRLLWIHLLALSFLSLTLAAGVPADAQTEFKSGGGGSNVIAGGNGTDLCSGEFGGGATVDCEVVE